jgi:hypothetical protein
VRCVDSPSSESASAVRAARQRTAIAMRCTSYRCLGSGATLPSTQARRRTRFAEAIGGNLARSGENTSAIGKSSDRFLSAGRRREVDGGQRAKSNSFAGPRRASALRGIRQPRDSGSQAVTRCTSTVRQRIHAGQRATIKRRLTYRPGSKLMPTSEAAATRTLSLQSWMGRS